MKAIVKDFNEREWKLERKEKGNFKNDYQDSVWYSKKFASDLYDSKTDEIVATHNSPLEIWIEQVNIGSDFSGWEWETLYAEVNDGGTICFSTFQNTGTTTFDIVEQCKEWCRENEYEYIKEFAA